MTDRQGADSKTQRQLSKNPKSFHMEAKIANKPNSGLVRGISAVIKTLGQKTNEGTGHSLRGAIKGEKHLQH